MDLSDQQLLDFLSTGDPAQIQALYDAAYKIKVAKIGKKISLRGLVECSNICRKNCYYCGIRHDNTKVGRFRLKREEVIAEIAWAYRHHFRAVVLQSGELETPDFTNYITDLVKAIMDLSNGQIGITLSCGEQSGDTYKQWREAGVRRYLLRIESSDPKFYAKLHPASHAYSRRLECLQIIKQLDYQLGTGVMIGLPGQTLQHLIADLRFFADLDIDMLGMGPYIPHQDTPLGRELTPTSAQYRNHQLELGLKMISCARLLLENINIASTTALQTLASNGRALGLRAGANVLMPNITDTRYRRNYQLYEGKPALDETAAESLEHLQAQVAALGEVLLLDDNGDSPHYQNRH